MQEERENKKTDIKGNLLIKKEQRKLSRNNPALTVSGCWLCPFPQNVLIFMALEITGDEITDYKFDDIGKALLILFMAAVLWVYF